MEEKVFGRIPEKNHDTIRKFSDDAEKMVDNIADLLKSAGLPFLATDRNVLNLPGVGKSLTFRVIGITRYGRRILEFDHDATRVHSPIIRKMGKMVIIESKSISEYLKHLEDIGENISEYESIWGYSLGKTESRFPLYEYPKYDFKITNKMTNLDVK
jgi:lysine 2,3-aminomutase